MTQRRRYRKGITIARWVTIGAFLLPGLTSLRAEAFPAPANSHTAERSLLAAEPPPLPTLPDSEVYLPSPTSQIHLQIRLGERRVYVYDGDQVKTSYPIAIGREGWDTPTGTFEVMQKIVDPSWEHPFTGQIVPPGAENPLGSRWIGFWTDGTNYIGFHGTPNAETVGQAASHGCIRMYDRDVMALFDLVDVGTPVSVVP